MKNKYLLMRSLMLLLALSLVTVSVQANDLTQKHSVPVILNQTSTVFDLEVPTSLLVSMSYQGEITTPSNVKIVNHSYCPMFVVGIDLVGKNGWELLNFTDTDMSLVEVDSKKATIEINGCIIENGVMEFKENAFNKMMGRGNNERNFCPIRYSAQVAPQQREMSEEIANVIITVSWFEA